jgi:hypothetical protein
LSTNINGALHLAPFVNLHTGFNYLYKNPFVIASVRYLQKTSGNPDVEEPSDIENIRVFDCGRAA